MNFTPDFTNAVKSYIGATSANISNGDLYIYYSDGSTQQLGPVNGYQIALNHGFSGTESEWATLQGESAMNAKTVASNLNESKDVLKQVQNCASLVSNESEEVKANLALSNRLLQDAQDDLSNTKKEVADIEDAIYNNADNIDKLIRVAETYHESLTIPYARIVTRKISSAMAAEMWEVG